MTVPAASFRTRNHTNYDSSDEFSDDPLQAAEHEDQVGNGQHMDNEWSNHGDNVYGRISNAHQGKSAYNNPTSNGSIARELDNYPRPNEHLKPNNKASMAPPTPTDTPPPLCSPMTAILTLPP